LGLSYLSLACGEQGLAIDERHYGLGSLTGFRTRACPADYGSSQVRFRYVGLDDLGRPDDRPRGLVTQSIGTDWTAERMLD
jgi:hypothetical protein